VKAAQATWRLKCSGRPRLMNDQVSLADFAIGGEPGAAGAEG
jgi:hypothetical protein